MITDEEYLKAVKVKLHYEKEQLNKRNVMFSLPSHAHLTKKALEVHGDDDSEMNMAKHTAWIAGGVWMLDECIKYLEGNGT
jgi:hypothetical protein